MTTGSGMGLGPLFADPLLANAEPNGGYMHDQHIPLNACTHEEATPLAKVGVGTVGLAMQSSAMLVIEWEATATTTDIVHVPWTAPYFFTEAETPDNPRFKFGAKYRKFDTTGSAAANADLSLSVDFTWINPLDTATNSITAIVTVLAAKSASLSGFAWLDLDIGAAIQTAGKTLLRGAAGVFVLAVNEPIGTALSLQINDIRVRYYRHATILPTTDRNW